MSKRNNQVQDQATPSAAIYVRVSTEEQAASGYGLDVQRERCAAMIAAKGWTLDTRHIYADAGISGTKAAGGRPGLAALLHAVEAGAVGAVVVLALDRLGRATRIVLDIVERITASGCELVSCKESLDTSSPAGRFVLTMFAALAQLERDNIVERTTAGRDQRGARDGERGGRVPFGYQRTPDGLVIDPDSALYVRAIYAKRERGATLQAIAGDLNAAGVASPRHGRCWYPSSVQAVLSNTDAYKGLARNGSGARWPRIL